jgi:hypothetical protein
MSEWPKREGRKKGPQPNLKLRVPGVAEGKDHDRVRTRGLAVTVALQLS